MYNESLSVDHEQTKYDRVIQVIKLSSYPITINIQRTSNVDKQQVK